MSGGVDSSVCAALLKDQGYDVTGVFMKNWSGDDFGLQSECPWEIDQKDAEAVCEKLEIPFKSYNFEKEYRQKVVDYFFEEYEKGRTPNPDVMCNKEIKFKLFLDKALSEGADFIATGHYVRSDPLNSPLLRPATSSVESGKQKGVMFNLLKGVDENKDQSYFLYNITQEQLSHCLFPIGEFIKPQIREMADKLELPNAKKPDSQGICFIGEINVHDFLKQRFGEKQGDIVNIDNGEIVGTHKGAYFYTIGQREGLGIGGAKEPFFVVNTNIKNNIVYVAMGTENKHLFSDTVNLENLHLITVPDVNIALAAQYFEQLQLSDNLSASVRYRHKPQKGKLIGNVDEGFKFIFENPQRAVTPGQSLVIYNDVVCLGGGVIAHRK